MESFTLVGMWTTMGWIARGVVIVLILMSIYSLGLAIERAWRFHRARKQSALVASRLTPLLDAHRIDEAVSLAQNGEYRDSHIARIVAAGLERYLKDRPHASDPQFDLAAAGRRAIERASLMATADMKRGLGNLATISTTAPFIGLFGTVIGIITAFRGMAASGSGGLGAVSAGISEALAATALGLFVAIPAVWLYNYFLGRIERFQVEMANTSSELVDYFVREQTTGES